jgi:hypothetical protein
VSQNKVANRTAGIGRALAVVIAFGSTSLGAVSSFCQSTPASGSLQSTTLSLKAHVDFLGTTAREPMLVEHPDGTLFVSGYTRTPQTVPTLWKSSDRGATWTAVNVGTEADGALGNSDVDLAVSGDGTLYFVALGVDRKTRQATHVAIGVSQDVGRTWQWRMPSKQPFCDRPWVAVAADGTAHAIWSEGSGVFHVLSRDRGTTWSTAQKIYSEGGSSHFAIGPKGELAARIIPLFAAGFKFAEGADLVLVSTDGGNTWQKRAVPGQRAWSRSPGATPRWVEPLAWDAKGDLYLLWTEVSGIWLARSLDRGLSWSASRIVETQGDTLFYYPYLAARGASEMVATWFSGAGSTLRWQVSWINAGKAGGRPEIRTSAQLLADSWDEGPPPEREPAGEYLAVLALADGDIAVVSPIQNENMKRFGFSFWRFQGPAGLR